LPHPDKPHGNRTKVVQNYISQIAICRTFEAEAACGPTHRPLAEVFPRCAFSRIDGSFTPGFSRRPLRWTAMPESHDWRLAICRFFSPLAAKFLATELSNSLTNERHLMKFNEFAPIFVRDSITVTNMGLLF
jgi:hypothetical protein